MGSDMERVRGLIAERAEQGWDDAWKIQVTPWDAGTAQPALRELIESQKVPLPRSGRALVPGCGRGYDAVCIAQELGLDTVGVDISPTAVQAAEEHLQSLRGQGLGDEVRVRFEVGDFFAMDGVSFELVYDYTFFVAIPPERRGEWGQQMRKLVKPGGTLITLVFPMEAYTERGPPFFVRVEDYDAALGDGWRTELDAVPTRTVASHVGRERLVVRTRR